MENTYFILYNVGFPEILFCFVHCSSLYQVLVVDNKHKVNDALWIKPFVSLLASMLSMPLGIDNKSIWLKLAPS